MNNLLTQLQIKFKIQLTKKDFKWCNNYRYDFYINNINCIIETHGLEHYRKDNRGSWGTLQEVQKRDNEKEHLAIKNGIENYIVLDCRKSELKWIKNSILNSKLPELLNFKEEDIDWLKCHEYACGNLIKDSCDLWNGGLRNMQEISKILRLTRHTIRKYLKQGVELGWCDYNIFETSRNGILKTHEINKIKVICLTTGEIFNSIKEASIKYNIKSHGNLSLCCKGKRNHCGKHQITKEKLKWMYYDEYLKTNSKELSLFDNSLLML